MPTLLLALADMRLEPPARAFELNSQLIASAHEIFAQDKVKTKMNRNIVLYIVILLKFVLTKNTLFLSKF
jgi:hypothetical protein